MSNRPKKSGSRYYEEDKSTRPARPEKYELNTKLKVYPLGDTALFKPLKLTESIELKHRVVYPPLTRFRAINKGQVPTEAMATYYKQRSQYPGTLVIPEAAFIAPFAGGYDRAPGIWSKEQVEGWKPVFQGIRDNGSFSFLQLWALGRQAVPENLKKKGLPYVSSSPYYAEEDFKERAIKCGNEIRALELKEIKEYIKAYAQAAKNAIEAGADGVELHGANSYLPNQFLDPIVNHRTDEYGGSIENCCRFHLEVLEALIEAVGSQRVGVRLSPWSYYGGMRGDNKTLFAHYAYLIGKLEEWAVEKGQRLAYIHLVEPMPLNYFVKEEAQVFEESNDFIYSIWKGPVIRTGNFAVNYDLLKQTVNGDNNRTLIGIGRYFISNPDLVHRLEKGLPLTQYYRPGFYGKTNEGYIDYPNYEEMVKSKF